MPKENNITNIHLAKNKEELHFFYKQDILVFALPLYVDGVPSALLHFLKELQLNKTMPFPIKIYVLVNCGFYESHQTKIAIDIMRNWCTKIGFDFFGAIGIGGGAMINEFLSAPMGSGPKKNLGRALKTLAKAISQEAEIEPLYVSPNFIRRLYILAAHHGWVVVGKKNGLSKKDLYFRK